MEDIVLVVCLKILSFVEDEISFPIIIGFISRIVLDLYS